MTAVYRSTFAYWLQDGSSNIGYIHAWLTQQLTMAEWAVQRFPFRA